MPWQAAGLPLLCQRYCIIKASHHKVARNEFFFRNSAQWISWYLLMLGFIDFLSFIDFGGVSGF